MGGANNWEGRVEISGMETGELSVTLYGVQLMLMLFADNYYIHLKVVTTYACSFAIF